MSSTADTKRWLGVVAQVQCCVLCGSPHNLQNAHRNEGKAMSKKNPPWLCARLCRTCHYEIDNGRALNRDERRALLDKAIVLTFDSLVRMGFVIPNPKGNGTCVPFE